MRASLLLLVTALAGAPLAAGAQGTLAGQGFGYPPGQLGARAAGSAGGVAEFDPISPINPAALSSWGPTGLFLEYEPEFRRIERDGRSSGLAISRFPLIAAGLTVSSNVTLGLAVSTLLDRTFVTTTELPASGPPLDIPSSTETLRSTGALNDVRLAGAWTIRRALKVGIALHAITGEHRIGYARAFDDTTGEFSTPTFQRTIGFGGTAVSAGADVQLTRLIGLGISGRYGGTIRARSGDTTLSSAGVPDRMGVALRYNGITGATIAARANWEGWSALTGLGSTRADATDAWDMSFGGDIAGPRIGSKLIILRTGVRWRTLPFLANGAEVDEFTAAFGAGMLIARDRATFDISAQRSSRDASGASERSWLIGLGLSVRP